MSKTNTNTNTNTNTSTSTSTSMTIRALHERTHALEIILNDSEHHTAQERTDAEQALQASLNTANAERLQRLYGDCDAAENPLQALLTNRAWSPYVVRKSTDRTTLHISVNLMTRRSRVNLLDYLRHVDETGLELSVSTDTLRNLLESATGALASFVLASVQQDDDGISVASVKAGLYNFVSKLGIAGLRVRNTDVRFLALAVAKARDLGELAEITPARLVPYMQDLVVMQLDGRQYGFAAKEKKETK